jgi:hypothetical protein
MSFTCKLPPTGWVCTCESGHTGPCATVPAISFESYLRTELAQDKIDFSFRAAITNIGVVVYIHPTDKDGATTPLLRVQDNILSVAPNSWTRGWGPTPDWMND